MYIRTGSKIKSISFVFILLLLFGCDDNEVVEINQNKYPYTHVEDNDCLPRAILVREAFATQGIWSRVLLYYFYDEPMGHAICIYVYAGNLWTYDGMGSFTIDSPDSLDDAIFIARQAEKIRGSGRRVKSARFIGSAPKSIQR